MGAPFSASSKTSNSRSTWERLHAHGPARRKASYPLPSSPLPRLSHAHDAAHATELSEHSLSALEEELQGPCAIMRLAGPSDMMRAHRPFT